MIIFNNYNELKQGNERIASELLNNVGEGEWQNEQIFLHVDVESFAEYEVTDGWYSQSNLERDYNGAPNLLDYINYKELGNELVRTWDNTCSYKTSNGEILNTSYGW